jgi:hypothetical protein
MTMATEQELFEARFHATATETIEKRYNAYPNHDRYTLYYMDWTNAPEKLVSNKMVFATASPRSKLDLIDETATSEYSLFESESEAARASSPDGSSKLCPV